MLVGLRSGFVKASTFPTSAPPPAVDMQSVDQDPVFETGENVEKFVSNVSFEFRHSEVPLHDRIAALFARLKQSDGKIQILPKDGIADNLLNPISESKNIPHDHTTFEQYFNSMSDNSRTIKFYAKVETSKPINRIKNQPTIFEYLRKHGIYMRYNYLESTKLTAVAWIYGQHPDAVSRHEIKQRMVGILGGFDKFQLNARQITLSQGSDIRTRGWVVEMDREDAKEQLGMFMESFHINARITIVPLMDPKAWDSKGVAETFFYKQNELLRDAVIIKVDGLKGLDVLNEDSDGNMLTLRQIFKAQETDTHQKVFKEVSQYNSKRVCFITTKELSEVARQLIDDFICEHLSSLDLESRSQYSFGSTPVRVGKREVPSTIATYMSQLLASSNFSIQDDDSVSLRSPPLSTGRRGNRSYVDVTKGSTTPSNNASPSIATARSTAQSTINNTQWSDFDTQLQHAETKLSALQQKIEVQQRKAEELQRSLSTRVSAIEERLTKILRHVTESQTTVSRQMDSQQAQLNQISTHLSTLVNTMAPAQHASDRSIQQTTMPSPIRKKRAPKQQASANQQEVLEHDEKAATSVAVATSTKNFRTILMDDESSEDEDTIGVEEMDLGKGWRGQPAITLGVQGKANQGTSPQRHITSYLSAPTNRNTEQRASPKLEVATEEAPVSAAQHHRTEGQQERRIPIRRPKRSITRAVPKHESNEPSGNPICEIPDDGSVLRTFVLNNHIRIEQESIDSVTGLKALAGIQVGIFGYSETNTNWRNGQVRENFKQALNKVWDHSKHQSSTSDWKLASIFKPGGTVTVATGRWSGRVFMAGEDPWGMGRFSYIGTKGVNKRKLMTITIYRVGSSLSIKSAGPSTVYHQEWNLLRSKGIVDPNPREQLITDLISFVKSNQAEGFEIHLMGDANVDMRQVGRRRGMGKLMHECQLQDLHAHHPATGTYITGKAPIDFMLGSAILADNVIRSGYMAFYDTHMADHRGLFVDVDAERFFGSKNSDATRPQARRLRSTKPKAVKKYLEYVKANLGSIPQQFQALLESDVCRDEAQRRYDTLDRMLQPIMEQAENKCDRLGPDESLWSTKLKASLLLVNYWKARKAQVKKKKIKDRKIARIREEIEKIVQVDDNGGMDKSYINSQLRTAHSQLRAARRSDAQNREEFLAHEIDEAKRQGDKVRTKRLVGMANAEKQKRSYNRIRTAMKSSRNGAVTALRVEEQHPGMNSRTVEILDPEEIQERLLERNRRHFQQAHETPFFDPRLIHLINDAADNPVSDAILEGVPVDILLEDFPEVEEFIHMMARPPSIQADSERISSEISPEEVRSGFSKWTESTSTSPSGRHLGHYKTWIQDEDMLQLLTTTLRIVIKFGFAPKRWCQSLNVMLEKDPGNPSINRLRVIHLYEADFNWMLKQFWAKRMLHYGEEKQVLGEEQHGSRRSRMATDAVMLKLMTYDLSRLFKTDLVTMDNDAKSCYDRIIISLATCQSTTRHASFGLKRARCNLAQYVASNTNESRDIKGSV